MIYVTLPSNSSMDIYADNKISSFKVNLPETFQVDPEHWGVALEEIQFLHLWYNVRKDKSYFIGWHSTVMERPSNKRVEFKFMKEIKYSYYSVIIGFWTEHRDTSRIQGHKFRFGWFQYSFWLWFLFQQVCCNYLSWSINKNGGTRLSYVIGIQGEWNSAWIYTCCISVHGKYGTIYSVICLNRYHSESVSGWCEKTFTSSSSSEIEIWRHNMCNLWTTSVPFSEQIQHSDCGNQYKERHRWASVIWIRKVDRDIFI